MGLVRHFGSYLGTPGTPSMPCTLLALDITHIIAHISVKDRIHSIQAQYMMHDILSWVLAAMPGRYTGICVSSFRPQMVKA